MEVGISLRNRLPIKTIIEMARLAEDRGFHSVWLPEGAGSKDVISQMAAVAMSTKRIKIASGIIPIFTRTPAILGSSFIGLDELSEGRCILGAGSGHIGTNRDYHGIKLERPVALMREHLAVVRLMFEKEQFSYQGKMVKVNNYRRLVQPFSPRIPIYIAALNPQMLGLVGEMADGVLLNVVTPDYMRKAKATIAERARVAGRDPARITIASHILSALGDERQGLAVIRDMVAHYGRDPFYAAMFTRAGYGPVLEKMAEPLSREDFAAAVALVPEEMAASLGMYGGADRWRATLKMFENAGLQLAVLNPPFDPMPGADPARGIRQLIDTFAKVAL